MEQGEAASPDLCPVLQVLYGTHLSSIDAPWFIPLREILEDFGYAYVISNSAAVPAEAVAGAEDHQLQSDLDHMHMQQQQHRSSR